MKPGQDPVKAVVQPLLPWIDRVLTRCSAIEQQEIFDNTAFPWAAQLEANWRAIRAEAETVLAERSVPPLRALSPDHAKIACDDRWRSFFLWGYGLRWTPNCARCPVTAAVLDSIPNLLTAFFSVLQPDAHIPLHTGPTKAILTAHLGLIVPRLAERCHMRVGGREVVWREGQLVVFDDMYPHEVWNESGETRVVLLMHVKRPEYFPGSLLQETLFAAMRHSSLVKDGKRNLALWDRPANG